MKKLFKRNQIIMTTLAALIAVAGYLNHIENNDKALEDTLGKGEEITAPKDIVDVSNEAESVNGAEGTPGEAILVNAVGTDSFIVEAKLDREETRMTNRDMLMEIVNNQNLSDSEKSKAVEEVQRLSAIAEREQAAETLLMAKGYKDVVVTITDDACDVMIVAETLSQADRAKIEEIVKNKTMIQAAKITITTVKTK